MYPKEHKIFTWKFISVSFSKIRIVSRIFGIFISRRHRFKQTLRESKILEQSQICTKSLWNRFVRKQSNTTEWFFEGSKRCMLQSWNSCFCRQSEYEFVFLWCCINSGGKWSSITYKTRSRELSELPWESSIFDKELSHTKPVIP